MKILKYIMLSISLLWTSNLQAQNWQVDHNSFEFSMNITGKVKLDGVLQNQASTTIAAFVDDDCRGVATAYQVYSGEICFFLTIYDNNASGEMLTFKYKDEHAVVHEFSQTVMFAADAIYGSPDQPYLWMNPVEYQATDFLSFSAPNQASPAVIDRQNHKIDIELIPGNKLTQLVVNFELPQGSLAYIGENLQLSGSTSNDFSDPLNYRVEGYDGSSTEWLISITSPTTVNELTAPTFNAYPNPATDYIVLDLPQQGDWQIRVQNISGNTVKELNINGISIIIPLKGLTPGVYFVRCQNKHTAAVRQKMLQ